MKVQASPVKLWALAHGLTVVQPRSLRLDGKFPQESEAARAALQAAAADVLVVAAYGLILPPWVLALPARGCLNIHGSLLPRWRGAAPIQRAIEAGDRQTGITIMQMDAGLDTGAMLLRQALAVADEDTTASLHDRLAALGAELIVQALRRIDELSPTVQPTEGVTYAHKIEKAEGAIDWRLPAASLACRIRAFDPFPGCSFGVSGDIVKLWRARVALGRGQPGEVLLAHDGRLLVACGEGALDLLELQRTGGRRVPVRDFLQGYRLAAGTRLD
jgi:methionyl-tRNA formyltransferase